MALWTKKTGEDIPVANELLPDTESHEPAESIGDLAATLNQLGSLLEATNRKVVDYLAMSESQAADLNGAAVQRLADRVESIAARLEGLPAGEKAAPSGSATASPGEAAATRDSMQPLEQRLAQIQETIVAWADHAAKRADLDQAISDGMGQLAERIDQQQQSLTGSLGHVWQRLDDGLREVSALLQPAQEEQADAPASNYQWQQALLGAELASQPELAAERDQFMAELLRGDDGARALAGQLLVFRATPMERMPQMLKDVGEAYYRWRPKTQPGAAPMERALAAWLEMKCDGAGIGNRIELVEPGERFDATRHNAAARGVEITEVLGWIVLRDNGRVYTKATVTVR